MSLGTMLNPLTHVVQVRRRGPGQGEWWETIAAFDNKKVADNYAESCRLNGMPYRVEPIVWPEGGL